MDIRQENPPAKPAVAILKPITAQLYKKVQKKLRKAKNPTKRQASGELSGAVPDMQKEKIPDPAVAMPIPSTEGRETTETAPSNQPAATAAAAGAPTSGNPTPPKLIPLDVITKAYNLLKPGEDLAVVVASIMAASDENHPETIQPVSATQNTPPPTTEATTPNPSPGQTVRSIRCDRTPSTQPSTTILDPEPIAFFIPKEKGKGVSEEPEGEQVGDVVEPRSSEAKGSDEEADKPTGASEEKAGDEGSERVTTGDVEGLVVGDEKVEGSQEEVDFENVKEKESQAPKNKKVDVGKEAETGRVEAEQQKAEDKPTGPSESEVLVIDDDVDSPVKEPQMTRRQRVSHRLYTIEAEKRKLSE